MGYGISPADVANLNNSLGNLGNTFRQGRLDEEQKRRDMEQELLRRQMNQATQQHYAAEEEHYKGETARADRAETRQSDIMKHAQSQQALQALQKGYEALSRNVANGTMTPEQGRAAAQRTVQQIKAGTDEILKNSPFAAILDDPNADIFSQPPAKSTARPAAELQYLDRADELESQANDTEDEDPDGAAKLREAAGLLRNHIKKTQPREPGLRKSVKTTDPRTGNSTTLSGPATQVDDAAAGTVNVKHPDGRTGTIPKANLPAALKAGFQLVQ